MVQKKKNYKERDGYEFGGRDLLAGYTEPPTGWKLCSLQHKKRNMILHPVPNIHEAKSVQEKFKKKIVKGEGSTDLLSCCCCLIAKWWQNLLQHHGL